MKKPNIVVITTDQQRFDTVSAYGKAPYGVKVKTDHLDQLAAEGVRFTNAFTCCPLCSPARTSFLTGTYPHTHKTMTNTNLHPLDNQIQPGDDLVINGLREEGYHTAYVGKWHVNNDINPDEFGYEHFVGLGDYDRYRATLEIPAAPQTKYYATAMGGYGDDPIDLERSRPAYLTKAAIGYIEQFAKEEQPFFVRLDFHGPHFPSVIPEPYASMYRPEDIQPIPSFYDDMTRKPAVQHNTPKYWEADRFTWQDWQKLIAKYMGECTLIDDMVGRVLDKLAELGLDEDTLVLFSTDHGDHLGAHKIWDKAFALYDDNCHVPLLARWKGRIPANSVCTEFVSHYVDMCPTILEAAGAQIPEQVQGQSFLPLCLGQKQERKPYIVSEFHGSHMGFYTIRSIRTEKYKYIFHTGADDEFYDLSEDPYEMSNRIEWPEYADMVKELKLHLVEWMRETRDHLYTEYMVYYLTKNEDLALQAPGRGRVKW